MSDHYRINVRFDMSKERERTAAEYLGKLSEKSSGTRNRFIVNAMITRIDVYNGYELNVEFNFNIRQFFEGIAEEESEAEKTAALPKTA